MMSCNKGSNVFRFAIKLREEKIGVWDEWMPTAALKDLLIYTET